MVGVKNSPEKLNKKLDFLSSSFLSKILLLLIKLLILVACLGFLAGVIKTFYELEMIFHDSVEETLRQLLLNVIILLAVVEIIKTALGYINEGRVRVTFVVDTVIIVFLNELISVWFKHPQLELIIMLCATILTLIFIRILAIKYSPNDD